MTGTTDTIEALVVGMVQERLGDTKVVSVRIEEETTLQDEAVLHVYVVYEPHRKKLDATKLSGLLRSLRPALQDIGEVRFPVLSFISNNDTQGTFAGAA